MPNTKHLAVGALLVFAVALLVRLPYVSYPPDVVFDEGINTSFISYYSHQKPFFDWMPPLAPMIFSAILSGKDIPLVAIRPVSSPQDNFPYIPLRVFVAIAGSLLAAVIFFIAFLLYRNVLFAALPSSFVIFDNALVVYSRIIVPEMLLLLFGFSGILCWMLSDHSKYGAEKPPNTGCFPSLRSSSTPSVVWFSAAAFFWALAASIKLTGLGFLLTAFLFLLYRKQYAKIAAALVVFVLVYIAVFFIFFSTIRDSAPSYTHFRNQEIQKIDFSTPKTIANFVPFFVQHHRATFLAHKREAPKGHDIHPLQWPFFHESVGFWGKSNSERINVSGNMIIWTSTALAVLVALVLIVFQKVDIPILPLVGYLANYVPFLLVPRALYLYHYFAALMFGFLLLPTLIGFFTHVFRTTPSVSPSRSLSRTKPASVRGSSSTLGVAVLILLAILWYIILIPRTYGIPFYSMI